MIDSSVSHDESVSVNYVLREYDDMKEEIKNFNDKKIWSMQSGKYYIVYISIIKSLKHLKQFNQVIIIMGVYTDDRELVIIMESTRINLPVKIKESLEDDIKLIVSRNECLTEYNINSKIR